MTTTLTPHRAMMSVAILSLLLAAVWLGRGGWGCHSPLRDGWGLGFWSAFILGLGLASVTVGLWLWLGPKAL